MISTSPWRKGPRFGCCRGRAAQVYVCSLCSFSRHYANSLPRNAHYPQQTGNRNVCRFGKCMPTRALHSGKNSLSNSQILSRDRTESELLQSELQGKGNIREYLRKWQNHSQLSKLDPIQVAETSESPNEQRKWVGTMLSDELVQSTDQPDLFEIEEFQYPDDESEVSHFLRPGDMVLLKPDGALADGQLAIYVRSIETQQQFYTIRGKWRAAYPNDVDFVFKSETFPELIEPLLPYFPTSRIEKGPLPQMAMEGGVPRPLGKPLIELMTAVELEAQKLYRNHMSILDNIHEVLADDTEVLILTLGDIVKKALGLKPNSLNDSELYAVHKALGRKSFYILPNQAISTTESYTIRPRNQSRIVDTVVQWVREYQNYRSDLSMRRTVKDIENHPVEKFIRKARQLILRSRRIRSPTTVNTLGPTAEKFSPNETEDGMVYSRVPVGQFSDTDRLILDYLRFWILPPSVMRGGMLKTAGSLILRSTGMYQDLPLTPAIGYLFLQEIGVFTPWENIHILSEQLSLPGHGICAASDRMMEESNRLCDEVDAESFEDAMKHLRKDWGNLTVFCIDSLHAAEIDDGFSLEPIPGSDDEFWIHVHVANPSAFVPPDHPLAQNAAYHKRSFYSPERVYPMFPPALTRARFSLAPDRRTLTFSAKLNVDGAILETNITNGYIRNVVFITPERLRKVFGIDCDLIPSITLTVGGTMPKPAREEVRDHVEDEHQALLHTLRELLSARREQRIKKGALESTPLERPEPFVSAGRKPIAPYSAHLQQAHHYVGDPVIQLSGFIEDPFKRVDSTRYNLVAHVMLLAGEIAAQWCKDRGIPLMFTGTVYHPEYPRVTNENVGRQGGAFFQLGLPRGLTSSKPVCHASLGMDQYTKCTSPLRRFSDLLGHWQIEAALRYEAEHQTLPPAACDESVLPFSAADIDTIIARSHWQNLGKDRAQSRSRDFWSCQLLFRALYFKEVQLPETFQCLIQSQIIERVSPAIQNDDRQYAGSLLPFGLRCLVTVDKDSGHVEPGDLVEVELLHVELYRIMVIVRVVQLIKRPPNGIFSAKGFVI